MIILDFLVYYLTYWFEKNRKKLVWSTPLQRAIYAIVLAITGFFVIVETILEHTIWKQSNFKISKYIVAIIGLGLIQFLNYIYTRRGRYDKISESGFKLNKRTGVVISIAIICFCTFGCLIIYMIIVPAGNANH